MEILCLTFAVLWLQAFYNWRSTRAELVELRKRAYGLTKIEDKGDETNGH